MQLEAGIICGKLDDGENIQLKEALEKAGIKVHLLLLEDIGVGFGLQKRFLHPKVDLDAVPGFIIRGIGHTSWPRSYFRLDVLYALEAGGKVLINRAKPTETAMDKFQSSTVLAAHGIPTPKTIVCENTKHAVAAFDMLGGDVLIKPIYGSQGFGITRISDRSWAERLFAEMQSFGLVYYLQEFHPCSSPPSLSIRRVHDVRMFVIEGEITAAMIREVQDPTEWKANIHAGAVPRDYSPDSDARELALKAADAAGLEIAGVDLLHSAKTGSWVVLEVNCAPGWTGISKVCGKDIPAEIAAFYRRKLKR